MAAGVVFGNLRTSEWEVTGLGLVVLAVGALVYIPWRRMFAGEAGHTDAGSE
jgi:hypothetical protein